MILLNDRGVLLVWFLLAFAPISTPSAFPLRNLEAFVGKCIMGTDLWMAKRSTAAYHWDSASSQLHIDHWQRGYLMSCSINMASDKGTKTKVAKVCSACMIQEWRSIIEIAWKNRRT